MSILRPGHPIFTTSFPSEKLAIDLSLCLRFVLQHGASNIMRDGIPGETDKMYGSRIDFGCAGSSYQQLAPGVWRPDLICGTDPFEKLSEKECSEVKASITMIYDCMQVACDSIQESTLLTRVYSFDQRNKTYTATLRSFLYAEVM